MTNPKKFLINLMDQVKDSIILKEGSAPPLHLGKGEGSLQATIEVHHPDFYSRVLSEGSLGLGESYCEGWWDVEDDRLVEFLGILLVSPLYFEITGNYRHLAKILFHRLRTSPATWARRKRNIASHYDLSNDFYQLMLDETMGYTCGYATGPEQSLQQLQENKYDLICRKLDLKPGDSLVDVGCGWGGFLIHAAKNYGIHGRGVTLSEDQVSLAGEKIRAAGLEDRISVDLLDYQELTGTYDKVAAIGIMEHVGLKHYRLFMEKLRDLLKPSGRGLVHTIGCTDQISVKPEPWIQKYIFPGGRLPRLQEIASAMLETDLTVAHMENLKQHYALTLNHWHRNVLRNQSAIRHLGPGFDEKFMRIWRWYLNSCEAGFQYDVLHLYQVLFCKGIDWPFGLLRGWPEAKARTRAGARGKPESPGSKRPHPEAVL